MMNTPSRIPVSEFSMIKLLMQLIVSASLVVAGSAFAGGFVVDTRAGKIQGVEKKGVHSFKGIPYAMAPVGDLRWQAPLPIDKPMKLVAATEFGPACPQSALPGMPVVNMSEDCLLLNVWTPQPDSKKRPVMVWIHGGGFRAGSGNIPGETFANQGVVLVSLNYRLGPLGFFSHQALPGQPANAGVLDMIAALHWVQNNIQNFGGDPDNVTIFGISAGGMAVNLLLANDSVKGLVHGAIAQSGYSAWALPRSKKAPNPAPKDVYMGTAEQAEIIARELVARVSNQPQTKAMLYQLDGLALVKAQKGFQVPIVDGESVMEEPGIRFMQGNQLDVPYMTGGNSYEGSVMRLAGISAENYRRSIGENLDHARRLYSKDSDDIWLSRMFGDNRYLLSARLLAANMSQVPSKSWLYYTDFVTAKEKDNIPGTTHGRDGYFIFAGHLDSNKSIQTLSSRMQRYWVNFARTGNPNGDGLLHWPTYDRASDRWMVFSENDTVQTDVISSKLDLLESMYKKRVTLHEQ